MLLVSGVIEFTKSALDLDEPMTSDPMAQVLQIMHGKKNLSFQIQQEYVRCNMDSKFSFRPHRIIRGWILIFTIVWH